MSAVKAGIRGAFYLRVSYDNHFYAMNGSVLFESVRWSSVNGKGVGLYLVDIGAGV